MNFRLGDNRTLKILVIVLSLEAFLNSFTTACSPSEAAFSTSTNAQPAASVPNPNSSTHATSQAQPDPTPAPTVTAAQPTPTPPKTPSATPWSPYVFAQSCNGMNALGAGGGFTDWQCRRCDNLYSSGPSQVTGCFTPSWPGGGNLTVSAMVQVYNGSPTFYGAPMNYAASGITACQIVDESACAVSAGEAYSFTNWTPGVGVFQGITDPNALPGLGLKLFTCTNAGCN